MLIELKNMFTGKNELVNLNKVLRVVEEYDKDVIFCIFIFEDEVREYLTSIKEIKDLHLSK